MMHSKTNFFLTLMAQGGVVMWILLGISLICLAIILERAFFWLKFLLRYSQSAQKALKNIETLEDFRKHQQAFSHAFQMPVESLLQVAYSKILIQAEYLEAELLNRYSKGHHILSIFVTISPLLGILGTVLGIVTAFKVLSNSSVQDPNMLSGGIAQALLTTIFGLMIAVVAFTAYGIFNAWIEKMQFKFSQMVSKIQILRHSLEIKGVENVDEVAEKN